MVFTRLVCGIGAALLVTFLTTPASGQTSTNQETLWQRWAMVFAEQDQQPPRQAGTTSNELLHTTFTTTFFALPALSPRLRDMTSDTDRPRTQGFQASSRWLKGAFMTEAEVANNAGWELGVSGKPGDTHDDASKRMTRFALTGESEQFRYGMMYRTAGKAFLNVPDQAGREVWGEWKWGSTKFRSAVGQLWNNVDADLTRSRLEQTYGRVGLSWTKPSWPELSLTYSRSSLSSALDPVGIAPQHTQHHTIEGALVYAGRSWNARVASTYAVSSDVLRGGAESTSLMQTFTALFQPLNTFTIAPTLAYREEIQQWSGVRIESPTAALALRYKQSQRLFMSATGNFTSTRSSDGLIDTENISGKGLLAWELQRALTWNAILAFEAGYSRVSNRTSPTTDTEDISGLVRLIVASL
jgi:hypothetical protein